MSNYPLIADHGLIGNLQTAALVATDGTIDWFCAPRFDSPSIFGCLLDHDHGGHLRTTPTADTFRRQQLYYPDTAILVTRFLTEAGVGEVLDFMPIVSTTVASDRHKLVRLIRCVRGEMTFAIDIAPRFDYGRESYETHVSENGVVFQGPQTAMVLDLVREPDDARLAQVQMASRDELRAKLTLSAGQMRGLVLETGEPRPPREMRVAEAWRLFDETVRFWRSWLSQSTYTGRWRETLERSAITLKLMTYAPSGGIVAAPTAALPEQIGGERNWDYRYTWIRDASFSVYALLGLGFTEEAARPAARSPVVDDVRDIALSVIMDRLPRQAPLWSVILITDLADGAAAVVVVLHHVLADGLGGLNVLAALVDPGAPPAALLFPQPKPPLSSLARDAWLTRARGSTSAGGVLAIISPSDVRRRRRPPSPRRPVLACATDRCTPEDGCHPAESGVCCSGSTSARCYDK